MTLRVAPYKRLSSLRSVTYSVFTQGKRTFFDPDEKPKSIKLGATTWNAGDESLPWISSGRILVTSMKLPGQP